MGNALNARKQSGGSRNLAALERAIEDDPDDASNILVYADLLQQRGDPRGELIVLQHGTSRNSRERKLREQLGFAGGKKTWRLGFVDRLEVGPDRIDKLGEMLDHAACRFLRELVVETTYDDAYEALPVIGAKQRPCLRSFKLTQQRIDDDDVRWQSDDHKHKAADEIWKRMPRLQRFEMIGWDLFYDISHDALTTLVIEDGHPMCFRESMAWDLPAVERIEWHFRSDATGTGTDVDPEGFFALWEGRLPKLRHLDLTRALCNAGVTSSIVDVKGLRKLAKNLSTLRLRGEAVGVDDTDEQTGDDLERKLLEHHRAFAHLEELGLTSPWGVSKKRRSAIRDRLASKIPGFRWL